MYFDLQNSTMANSTMEVGKSPRVGMSKWKIELTDGWYSIPACIDLGMEKNVSTGKVREGTKLLIYGAELLNCDVACYPLEVSDSDPDWHIGLVLNNRTTKAVKLTGLQFLVKFMLKSLIVSSCNAQLICYLARRHQLTCVSSCTRIRLDVLDGTRNWDTRHARDQYP